MKNHKNMNVFSWCNRLRRWCGPVHGPSCRHLLYKCSARKRLMFGLMFGHNGDYYQLRLFIMKDWMCVQDFGLLISCTPFCPSCVCRIATTPISDLFSFESVLNTKVNSINLFKIDFSFIKYSGPVRFRRHRSEKRKCITLCPVDLCPIQIRDRSSLSAIRTATKLHQKTTMRFVWWKYLHHSGDIITLDQIFFQSFRVRNSRTMAFEW